MSLFNAKNAVDAVKERRATVKAASAEVEPKSPNAFQLMAADNKMLRDENARLFSRIAAVEGRVDGHDSKFSDYDAWQAEAKKRVDRLETASGGTSQRQCPGCQELRADGPEMFPGYSERAATSPESEFHAWRQLCAVCRDGKQAPEHG